jgi:hypothetical protein
MLFAMAVGTDQLALIELGSDNLNWLPILDRLTDHERLVAVVMKVECRCTTVITAALASLFRLPLANCRPESIPLRLDATINLRFVALVPSSLYAAAILNVLIGHIS